MWSKNLLNIKIEIVENIKVIFAYNVLLGIILTLMESVHLFILTVKLGIQKGIVRVVIKALRRVADFVWNKKSFFQLLLPLKVNLTLNKLNVLKLMKIKFV